MTSPGATDRFNQLDSLRGLAALSVVFWHWVFLLQSPGLPGAQAAAFRAAASQHDPRLLGRLGAPALLAMSPLRLFFGGYEAVVLFFVLSGFVLSLSFWAGKPISYRPFLVKRIFRIYVPYLAALALAVTGNAWLSRGGIPALNQWFNSTWRLPVHPGDVIAHIILLGAYNDIAFNTAFWSLIHEMRISIVFPFVLLAMKHAGPKDKWIPWLLILAGGWLNARLPYGRIFASLQVLGFFLVGSCIARLRLPLVSSWRAWPHPYKVVFLCGSVALFSFGWLWTFPLYALGWNLSSKDLFIAAGAGGLLILALASRRTCSLLLADLPRLLGRMSYSLYLVHATVLWSLLYLLYGRLNLREIFPLYILISLLLAFAFSKVVERPAHQAGRRLARRLSHPPAARLAASL